MYSNSIIRRNSNLINLGNVAIGGSSPITVQSMTNTTTEDIKGTVAQIKQLEEAGVDIVRVSCPNVASTKQLDQIVQSTSVPIVADIHFNYKRALEAAEKGVACLRINPGNIGGKDKVMEVVRAAQDNNCVMRIGVNSGSLESFLLDKYREPCADAMVESAMHHAKILEDCGFTNFKISVKSSNIFMCVEAYQKLANQCKYPLHLGITESGTLKNGGTLSSIGIGSLLMQGIGDTIRVSLSADPVEEVILGKRILKVLGLSSVGVRIISCPSCARQGYDVVNVVPDIESRLDHIKENITISMLGCVVNGIGEAEHANLGIVGMPDGKSLIYVDGKKDHKVANDQLVEHVVSLVEDYVSKI